MPLNEDRRRPPVLVPLLILAGLTAGGWYVTHQKEPLSIADQIASVASLLVALVALTLTLIDRRSPSFAVTADKVPLDAAADALAERSLAEWLPEAAVHDLDPADPIPVAWAWDPKRSRSRDDFPAKARPPAHGVVNRLYERVYDLLPRSTLLVLLGQKGTGKSAAMLLLLLAALQDREARLRRDLARGGTPRRLPVPVWITVGGWNPDVRPLRQLAAEALEWMLPALGNDRNFGPGMAQQLIERGAVALFLDGLDEMPDDLRDKAMTAAAREVRAGLRIVVTARPDGYVRPRIPGSRIPAPVVVQLQPLDAETVAAYVTRRHTGDESTAWAQVAAHLRDHPNGLVASALDTPLIVSLALAAYAWPLPACHDPRDLLKATSDTAIRNDVIELFLHRAYPADPDELARQEAHRRATTGGPRRKVTAAARWRMQRERRRGLALLEWTAFHLRDNSDLHWWKIPAWVSPDRLAGVCTITAGALASILALLGDLAVRQPPSVMTVAAWMLGLGVGGVYGGLSFNRFMASRTGPARLRVRWPDRAEATHVLGQAFTVGLPFGIGVGLVRGVAAGATIGTGFFMLGLFGGDLGPRDRGLLAIWSRPLVDSPTMTPVSSYRSDLLRTGIVVAVAMPAVSVFLTLCGQFDDASDYGIRFGPGLGLLLGLFLGMGPAVLLLLAPLAARGTGAGSRSVAGLLRSAHDLKVVRQAGMVYQFRHRELQAHLARRYQSRSSPVPRPENRSRTPVSASRPGSVR
ncbi:hypothetical protein V6U89_18820 [Micromonospora sp. CPCC 206171]|uniref:hypothetical protein n=1 Tax=Micromonospora sp. CPCC 206171 TaxID=3122405 RepID=UPI002FF2EFF6